MTWDHMSSSGHHGCKLSSSGALLPRTTSDGSADNNMNSNNNSNNKNNNRNNSNSPSPLGYERVRSPSLLNVVV